MLTQAKESQLRDKAAVLADALYSQVSQAKLTHDGSIAGVAQVVEEQDYFEAAVVQCLSQRATATRVENEQWVREGHRG